MTVQELIAALSTLPPDMYVCGITDREYTGLFSGVSKVYTANKWHDSLPQGAQYVDLCFYNVIPHTRGEGIWREQVPPPVVEFQQKCEYCDYTVRTKDHTHCKKCYWLPMLKIVGKYTDGEYESIHTKPTTT